jgi:dTDP-4-dehydrorhamnose reductase
MNKVLVLGDGLLGSEIVKQTGWDYISRKNHRFDIRAIESSYDSFGLNRYNVIINCIAYTDTYSTNKELHLDINYKSVINLSNYCNRNDIKLVHISTDYIYANSISKASEEDVPVHINTWYGYSKLLGDAYVQLNKKNLVIRTSHKPYPFPYQKAWANQFTNGDYVNVIAALIIKLVQLDLNGIYNVGTEEKTWFNLTKEEFNTQPISKPDAAPSDISMNVNKLYNEIH